MAWLNWWFLPLPVAALIALAVYHERIARKITCEKRGIAFYERGLARLDGAWGGQGESGERFRDAAHPYAEDLDLFGRSSMFQLLCTARTRGGEDRLASWLLQPASASEVRSRQEAVSELTPRVDLREDLALLGEDVRADVHAHLLETWGTQAGVTFPAWIRLAAAASAACMAVLCLGWLFEFWQARPVLVFILIQGSFGLWLRDRVLAVLGKVELPATDLALIAGLLARIEQEPFSSERLVQLRREFELDGISPSHQIARLGRLIEWHDWSHNQFFRPIARLLLWSTQFSIAIESWRQRSGPLIGRWLAAVSEVEALSCFAAYSAENPDDSFPELVEAGPLFDAEGLTHPLLAPSAAVRNDIRLDGALRILVVSGSNMSGKSTMLRSVGLNAVLAWAGAPVRARSLRISELTVGASIRVLDSLQDGKSRFYAEITRLRQIVGMAESEGHLLYLLDELLSGTNSHDRRIGAEAIVTTLVNQGAIGLVTTHDLALAGIVDDVAPHAANVHFEDHLEDGKIVFDYRMRPGVVQKSNAIELMRSVGLKI